MEQALKALTYRNKTFKTCLLTIQPKYLTDNSCTFRQTWLKHWYLVFLFFNESNTFQMRIAFKHTRVTTVLIFELIVLLCHWIAIMEDRVKVNIYVLTTVLTLCYFINVGVTWFLNAKSLYLVSHWTLLVWLLWSVIIVFRYWFFVVVILGIKLLNS